jgi:CubicO group peptidase (beta-lactamase class C family)
MAGRESTVVWQEGNLPGFNSYVVLNPSLQIGLVVLTNESDRNSSHRLTLMINRILKAMDDRAVLLP